MADVQPASKSAPSAASETAAATSKKGKKPAKAKVTKPRAPNNAAPRFSYPSMVIEAITKLSKKNGSSLPSIERYIADVYNLKAVVYIRKAVSNLLEIGKLEQHKGTGAAGSFKLAVKSKLPAYINKDDDNNERMEEDEDHNDYVEPEDDPDLNVQLRSSTILFKHIKPMQDEVPKRKLPDPAKTPKSQKKAALKKSPAATVTPKNVNGTTKAKATQRQIKEKSTVADVQSDSDSVLAEASVAAVIPKSGKGTTKTKVAQGQNLNVTKPKAIAANKVAREKSATTNLTLEKTKASKPEKALRKQPRRQVKRATLKKPAANKQKMELDDNDLGPDQYHINKIVGHRIRNGNEEYKVQWTNYKTDSWEPAENISAEECVKEFKDRKKKNEGKNSNPIAMTAKEAKQQRNSMTPQPFLISLPDTSPLNEQSAFGMYFRSQLNKADTNTDMDELLRISTAKWKNLKESTKSLYEKSALVHKTTATTTTTVSKGIPIQQEEKQESRPNMIRLSPRKAIRIKSSSPSNNPSAIRGEVKTDEEIGEKDIIS